MNKYFLFLLILCSSLSNAEIKYLHFTSNKVWNRIYIELPAKNVTVHCEPLEKGLLPEDRVVSTYLITETNYFVHHFSFRRSWSVEECQRRKKEIRKIINGDSVVRIIGVVGEKGHCSVEKDDEGRINECKRHLEYFSWIFERIENSKGYCVSYFEDDCMKDFEDFFPQ